MNVIDRGAYTRKPKLSLLHLLAAHVTPYFSRQNIAKVQLSVQQTKCLTLLFFQRPHGLFWFSFLPCY